MAATIAGAPSVRELRIHFLDEASETADIGIPLDGAATDADIQTIIDDYAALTNARISAAVVDKFEVTGIAVAGKPADALQSLVATILAMEFTKANPLNTSKIVRKTVLLPAYLAALRDDTSFPHKPVTNNATFNALWALLQTNLDLVMIDDVHYPGQWTYNPSSKFGTKGTVTDGY